MCPTGRHDFGFGIQESRRSDARRVQLTIQQPMSVVLSHGQPYGAVRIAIGRWMSDSAVVNAVGATEKPTPAKASFA